MQTPLQQVWVIVNAHVESQQRGRKRETEGEEVGSLMEQKDLWLAYTPCLKNPSAMMWALELKLF